MRKSTLLMAAAIAIVAYAAAGLVHEVVGHALVAKASGVRVLSISTVAASTEPASRTVATAGTMADVVLGAIALALVARKRHFNAGRYSLWLSGVVSTMNSAYLGVFRSVRQQGLAGGRNARRRAPRDTMDRRRLLLVSGALASDVKEPGWISSALEIQPAWIVAAVIVGIVFVGVFGPAIPWRAEDADEAH